MKKFLSLILVLVLAAALMAGCKSNGSTSQESAPESSGEASSESSVEPIELFTITAHTEGFGEIMTAREGEEIVFDDEYPMQSTVDNLAKGEKLTIACRPEEGYAFIKWTKNGERYSTDTQITVIAEEDADFVASFGMSSGYEGEGEVPADAEDIKTMGDAFMLPYSSSGYTAENYIYVFELNDITYRAIADLTPEVSDALGALDFDDADYNAKATAIVAPLEVSRLENLSDAAPTQEELDQLVGKTGEELMADNWYCVGYNLDDMEFFMEHGIFSYTVFFEGEVENVEEFDQDEEMKSFVVKSVRFEGLGDTTNLDYPIE